MGDVVIRIEKAQTSPGCPNKLKTIPRNGFSSLGSTGIGREVLHYPVIKCRFLSSRKFTPDIFRLYWNFRVFEILHDERKMPVAEEVGVADE